MHFRGDWDLDGAHGSMVLGDELDEVGQGLLVVKLGADELRAWLVILRKISCLLGIIGLRELMH